MPSTGLPSMIRRALSAAPSGFTVTVSLSVVGAVTVAVAEPAPGPVVATAEPVAEPVFAPDGRSIYFVSDRGGGPQVYRMPAAGGAVQRVTFDGRYNISPSVSPDGRMLAYIARQGGGAFKLMVMDLAGGAPQAITETDDDESPSFAPNGRLIIYATRAQGRDVLMTTTLDGKIKARLASSGADVREPAWGPYGR